MAECTCTTSRPHASGASRASERASPAPAGVRAERVQPHVVAPGQRLPDRRFGRAGDVDRPAVRVGALDEIQHVARPRRGSGCEARRRRLRAAIRGYCARSRASGRRSRQLAALDEPERIPRSPVAAQADRDRRHAGLARRGLRRAPGHDEAVRVDLDPRRAPDRRRRTRSSSSARSTRSRRIYADAATAPDTLGTAQRALPNGRVARRHHRARPSRGRRSSR